MSLNQRAIFEGGSANAINCSAMNELRSHRGSAAGNEKIKKVRNDEGIQVGGENI